MRVNNLVNKVMLLEINEDYLEQYTESNNLEFTRIPDNVSDENPGRKSNPSS